MIVLNSIIENCVTCVGAATESLYLIYRRLKLTEIVAAHRNVIHDQCVSSNGTTAIFTFTERSTVNASNNMSLIDL